MPTPEPLSPGLQQLWQMIDGYAVQREPLRLSADQTQRISEILHTAYHRAMALEMALARLEENLDRAGLIAFARTGEIGPPKTEAAEIGATEIAATDIPCVDGRPQIELTPAGYQALSLETFGASGGHVAAGPVIAEKPRFGVGPLCGQVVEAGKAFERRRLEAVQRRLQAALDAEDHDAATRIIDQLNADHGPCEAGRVIDAAIQQVETSGGAA